MRRTGAVLFLKLGGKGIDSTQALDRGLVLDTVLAKKLVVLDLRSGNLFGAALVTAHDTLGFIIQVYRRLAGIVDGLGCGTGEAGGAIGVALHGAVASHQMECALVAFGTGRGGAPASGRATLGAAPGGRLATALGGCLATAATLLAAGGLGPRVLSLG